MSTHVHAPRNARVYPITANQKSFIQGLLTERNLTGTKYEGWAPDWNRATKDSASEVIGDLLKLPRLAKRDVHANAMQVARQVQQAMQTVAQKPRVDFSVVPVSFYALETTPGHLEFFEVTTGKAGTRYENYRFVAKCIGAPGSWRKQEYRGAQAAAILTKIIEDEYTDTFPATGPVDHKGPRAGQVRYGREFKACAKCNSPLSDDVKKYKDGLSSLERGIGPDCAGVR